MASLETIHGTDGWESCILNIDSLSCWNHVVQTLSTGSSRLRLGHFQRLVQIKHVGSHKEHPRDFWDMVNAVKIGFESSIKDN